MLYFKRDIEADLLNWKKNSNRILMLNGARQVGKTTVLKHFAEENFKNVIYVSFEEDTGNLLLSCIAQCRANPKPQTFYVDIFKEFSKYAVAEFTNDENTIVIIDEIQRSQEVYEMIKPFRDNLHCRVAVIGSYLYQAIDYFQPVGCTDNVTMYPMSFLEFLDVLGKRAELETLYQNNNFEYSDFYECTYKRYCIVGGYPAAVTAYLDSRDIVHIREIQESIIDTVLTEMASYHKNAAYRYQLEIILQAVVDYMLQEKRSGSFVEDIHELILKNNNIFIISKQELKNSIALLAAIGIFSFCGIFLLCDMYIFEINQDNPCERIYFNDLGLLGFYLEKMRGFDGDKSGLMSENFVFKTLNEPCKYHKLIGIKPRFGAIQDGEMDFVVASDADDNLYSVEVKTGTAKANRGELPLDQEKIDYLVTFKEIQNFNTVEKVEILPIWLAPMYKYNVNNVIKQDPLKEPYEDLDEILNKINEAVSEINI